MKIFIFLAFTAMLFVFPQWLYRNRRFRPVWVMMAFSGKCRRFVAMLMCLALLLFHIAYFAVFPTHQGVIISSLIAFASLATKYSVRVLEIIRRSGKLAIALAVLAIALAFVPEMLSVSISLAFILEFACCFPSKQKARHIKNC